MLFLWYRLVKMAWTDVRFAPGPFALNSFHWARRSPPASKSTKPSRKSTCPGTTSVMRASRCRCERDDLVSVTRPLHSRLPLRQALAKCLKVNRTITKVVLHVNSIRTEGAQVPLRKKWLSLPDSSLPQSTCARQCWKPCKPTVRCRRSILGSTILGRRARRGDSGGSASRPWSFPLKLELEVKIKIGLRLLANKATRCYVGVC